MKTSVGGISPNIGASDVPKSIALKHPWRFVVLCSLLQFGVYGFGSAYEMIVSNAVCFHFVFAYFIALVVVVPVIATRRFGAGIGVFIPYAIIGFFIEYYLEWVVNPTLIAPWGAAIWSLFGLLTGLVADVAYRFLPRRLAGLKRAVVLGVIVGLADFCLTLAVLSFPYKDPVPGVAHFINGLPLTLPYLLLSAAFAGYTAHAIAEHMSERNLPERED